MDASVLFPPDPSDVDENGAPREIQIPINLKLVTSERVDNGVRATFAILDGDKPVDELPSFTITLPLDISNRPESAAREAERALHFVFTAFGLIANTKAGSPLEVR